RSASRRPSPRRSSKRQLEAARHRRRTSDPRTRSPGVGGSIRRASPEWRDPLERPARRPSWTKGGPNRAGNGAREPAEDARQRAREGRRSLPAAFDWPRARWGAGMRSLEETRIVEATYPSYTPTLRTLSNTERRHGGGV